MEQLRYHIIDGKILGVGYNPAYNTLADGTEPFFDNWKQGTNINFEDGKWKPIKPMQRVRYIELQAPMPDRAGYERILFVNSFPFLDFENGQVIVEVQVKHYIKGEWQYNEKIQDKMLTMIADDETRIPIDDQGNTWGEFQYFAYIFENFQVYFLQEVMHIINDRIETGKIDKRLSY
jgi:hypothetical protein